MYAKILILLVLAILCTGCTDPDLLDPYEFENVTPGAPALQKSWNPETQTITISTLDDTPRLTIRKVSAVPDLCTFEEVLEIKSFVDYNLNKLKDFRARWKKHKGQHDISKVEWFILKNESYDIIVNDYKTIQVEETHYDNVTEEYYNVTVNQTVFVGNHSEIRYHDIWKPFSPAGKSIHAGQTYTVKIVYHKLPELGNVRIQTIPMFAGIECEELTWWNTSWSKRVQLNVNNSSVALTDYQLMKNITYDSDMNVDFSDLRFTNDSGVKIDNWEESVTNSTSVDMWLKIPSISTTTGAQVWMYYENADVSSASSGDDVFLVFDDAESGAPSDKWNSIVGAISEMSYQSTTVYSGTNSIKILGTSEQVIASNLTGFDDIVVEAEIKISAATTSCMFNGRASNSANTFYGFRIRDTSTNDDELFKRVAGTWTKLDYAASSTDTTVWGTWKITMDGTSIKTYFNDVLRNEDVDSSIPTGGVGFRANFETIYADNVRVRKYTATEPTWAADGEEESVSIITAYTPPTPLQKTTGDSQLFTVNTSENSQCRWYINGSLMQTNSTGATRHEYTNSSLEEGYWNFTATANTTDQTSSQTWWVTVSAVGTFGQDMYIDRWMYTTYLDGSNTNLSEFFIDLAPYYLSFYNATDQKTYNYKSGRWEKYADKIIKPGEAAMLRYTANVTKTRDNAGGTFGFTMKTGLNHIGHSYNGSRNLTWYNTTVASANLVTIAHQNPETGTLSTFTYGSADNGSVDVLQGCGVEVNVSADTVISGL